jgi:hypothetical protein
MTADAASTVPMLEARIDKLTQALLHVAGELWVTRDRQAVLERLLTDAGLSAPTLIDSYRPDAALAETLAAQREAFVAQILAYLAPDA